jgi:hypothetical protein
MSFTTINYEEPNPKTYKSVEIHDFDDNITKFESGDFVKDWYDLTKFLLTNLINEPFHTHSSSVDHFIMDGAPFDSMYLGFDDETKTPILSDDYDDGGVELFVKKGTKPTWNELRKLVGDEKITE